MFQAYWPLITGHPVCPIFSASPIANLLKFEYMTVGNYSAAHFHFLEGGGEMGQVTRTFDWSATSLRSPNHWPQSLRTAVSIVLNARFPMFLWWGPDLICFYNDAYRPSLGNEGKHPGILGMKAIDAWPEIWHIIQPLINQVLEEGKSVWFEDQLVPIFRNGQIENVYWTFSYSRVSDENSAAAGVLVTCTETTDKVVTAANLRKNEERLRFSLTAGNLGSWTLHLPTLEMEASNICKQNFGRPVDKPFTYQNLQEAIHPEDLLRMQATVQQVLESGTDYYIEYRVIWPDKTVHWVNLTGRLRYDNDGKPIEMLGISQEITERKLVESVLQESEQRFRAMAESSPIYIAMADVTSDAIYFNKAWCELSGRSMSQLVAFKWAELLHPDDKDQYLNTYLEAFGERKPYTAELRVQRADGEYRWLLAHVTPRFNMDATFAGYISACVDITDRKSIETEKEKATAELERALEQARLAKEAADLGTFDLDLLAGTMVWDKRCRILFGISHDNPVSYEHDFVLGLHPHDREKILRIIDDAFTKSRTNGNYDVQYRTVGFEDQKIRWVKAKGKVYFDEAENPVRFIGSVLDITDQVNQLKRVEELVAERTQELALLNIDLQKTNAELAQFAYIASHDLQEPLRKITTFLGLLARSIGPDMNADSKNYLERIQNSGSRMQKLIRDVLDFSRIAHEQEVFDSVDLNSVLQDVLGNYDLLIEETGASIIADKLPVITANPLHMYQLFSNLIGNALKFRKEDTHPIISIISMQASRQEVGKHGLDQDKEYHRIEMRDNGIGISPVFAEKIFLIFQRLHNRNEYDGTGIGLAMCRKIVSNHQGAITAEGSELGKAIITIFLPAHIEVEAFLPG
ncbi:PAS domain-containing protein [Paraflavitalea sp. CAU 1676]|uniref:PAS domain-containing sensor histidine kinase n=1 Tax=Paraflavitalea sp. CAU 1676 TaxID=3032598 RepID=UPI0023DBE3D0|nr:PAS domain-containing protein [Paraflavitalea sp. CAU 1676]MDF2191219.1 PAS domain-containing protein [Paraflavitalea sp. CAU 1676]